MKCYAKEAKSAQLLDIMCGHLLKRFVVMRNVLAILALFLTLPHSTTARDIPSEPYLDDGCLISVWAPSSDKLANQTEWRQKSAYNRLQFDDDAPTEDGDALVTYARKGVPGSLLRHKGKLPEAHKQKPSVARIQNKIFVPDDSGFNYSNAKMPLGIWGGKKGAAFCGAGLCPPDEQTGFTVRLTRSRIDRDDKKPPFRHGLRIYSYHLNRDGEVKNSTAADKKVRKRTQKGDGTPLKTPLEPGVWYHLILDVGLNSFKDGKPVADGWTQLYMFDGNGNLLDTAGKTGLIYSPSPDWYIFGPVLTDLWGGDETRPQNLPLADTRIYYEDYEMFFLDPDRTLGACKTGP